MNVCACGWAVRNCCGLSPPNQCQSNIQPLFHSYFYPVEWGGENTTKGSKAEINDREGSLTSYGHEQKTGLTWKQNQFHSNKTTAKLPTESAQGNNKHNWLLNMPSLWSFLIPSQTLLPSTPWGAWARVMGIMVILSLFHVFPVTLFSSGEHSSHSYPDAP